MAGSPADSQQKLEFDEETLRAIAEVYKDEGNDEYKRREFTNAVDFYSQGLQVNCKDDDLNAKLHSNRATAHFYLENYHDTISDAKAALHLKPNYIKAIERGSSACMKLGMHEEVVTWCDKGLALIKNNKKLLDLRSKAIEASGNVKGSFRSRGPGENETETPIDLANLCGIRSKGLEELYEPLLEVAVNTGNKPLQQILYAEVGHRSRRTGSVKKAIHFYKLALKIAKELKDRRGEGRAYSHLGNAEFDLGNFKMCLSYHQLHLNIAKEVGDRKQERGAYGNLGNAYHQLGDPKRAIFYHKLSLEISKELGDRDGEGSAYGNLGNSYDLLGDFEKAIDYHKSQLTIAKEVGNRIAEGTVYGNLGIDYLRLGDVDKAIHNHELFLRFTKEMGDRNSEAKAYNSLGADYLSRGDFEKAVYYHSMSLDICKQVENKAEEGRACGNLGSSYQNLGDYKKALYYNQLHLELAKETGSKNEQGRVSGKIGTVYWSVGDFKKAISYHEVCLAISKEVCDKVAEGYAYNSLGRDYQSLGDMEKAMRYQRLSLAVCKDIGNRNGEGAAYASLGNSFQNLGDIKDAIQYHESSLKIFKEIGDRSNEGCAYGNLGNAYQSLGDFKTAIRYHKLQVDFAKEVGSKAQEGLGYLNLGNDYHKLSNHKEAIHYHELSLKVAKEVGDTPAVGMAYGNLGNDYDDLKDFTRALDCHKMHLEIAEKLGERAQVATACGNLGNAFRGLQDFQNAVYFYKQQLEVAKEVKDIVGEGAANNNLGCIYETQECYMDSVAFYKSSVRLVNDVRARLHLKDEWKINLRHLYQNCYTRLWCVLLKLEKVTEALSAAEQGRTQALKDLMEYNYRLAPSDDESFTPEDSVVEDLSYLPSNTVFVAMTDSNVVSWLIREGKVVDLSFERTGDFDSTTFFRSLLKNAFDRIGVTSRKGTKCEDRSLDGEKDDEIENETSSQTHSRPEHLKSNALRSLYDIIVAPFEDSIDGDELAVVPEGLLWLAPYAALMDKNSKYLSESLRIRVIPSLTSLKMIANCPADYHCKNGALLVGDPWVQEIVIPGEKILEQLPCAKEEVEMIGRILDTKPLTGREATKNEVLRRLSSVALVHIAAHGRMETGEIALSPNPLRKTQLPEEDDYLLTITDVLNAKLRARIVVLSCCHSGRGEIKAEGVVGIARAFLGAGARSVLVSLWAIDDEATLEFMKRFYQQLAKGKSASEALSKAMKSMRESDELNKVEYWAPFLLIGDDITLGIGEGHD
ncbi:tetratricopeptide repeat protein 28-like [Montipora capricornis]|uniref:tetratricopeptide repeat protein 28-like n=2 Tax=Montipora capricornis TaxID=246305 RepID=UPI0035F104DA